jgi:uncharacterized membrane protein YoaK (UPF0700 family)
VKETVPSADEARGFPRWLWADRRFGPLPVLMLTLSAVTGVVDGVSILSLGRVFVATMTGNVVFAGFALAGAPGFSLSASLFALAGFLTGAGAAGSLIARVGTDRAAMLRAGVLAELILIAAALAVAAASGAPAVSHGTRAIAGAPFGAATTDAVAALLAVALGAQNAVSRKLAVPDLTTAPLTMTITGLGAEFRALIKRGGGDRDIRAAHARRLLAITTTVAGVMVSAWLVLDVSAVAALALSAGLITITAAGAVLAAARPAPWRGMPVPVGVMTPAITPAGSSGCWTGSGIASQLGPDLLHLDDIRSHRRSLIGRCPVLRRPSGNDSQREDDRNRRSISDGATTTRS